MTTVSKLALSEFESKTLIAREGFPVPEQRSVRSPEEASVAAKEIGGPVVLKAISPGLAHKSEVGGVRLNLRSDLEVRRAYAEIVSAFRKQRLKLEGVSVQSMEEPGLELVIGMERDDIFGPLLMFGLGGTSVEVLRDVQFRLAPLSKKDAEAMVRGVKSYPLIKGHRGGPRYDEKWIVDLLVKSSEFALAHEEIVEMDLNPVILRTRRGTIADARIVVLRDQERSRAARRSSA